MAAGTPGCTGTQGKKMGENARKNRRAKVLSMTVRYRSATLGEFIEHHSYDVSKGGMFIKTPSPFPPGTLLKFEVKIAAEQRVMQGVGRVVWKRDEEGTTGEEPPGMGIKFIKIDDASRTVISRLVEERGTDTAGAFDNRPESISPRSGKSMFPDLPPAVPLAPEDRTQLKPVKELLDEALKKTGQEPAVSDAIAGASGPRGEGAASNSDGVVQGEASKQSKRKSPSKKGSSNAESGGGPRPRPRTGPIQGKSQERSKQDSASGEEGGGRALLTLLAAVAVAVGIYFATKSGHDSQGDSRSEPGKNHTGDESQNPSETQSEAMEQDPNVVDTVGEFGADLAPLTDGLESDANAAVGDAEQAEAAAASQLAADAALVAAAEKAAAQQAAEKAARADRIRRAANQRVARKRRLEKEAAEKAAQVQAEPTPAAEADLLTNDAAGRKTASPGASAPDSQPGSSSKKSSAGSVSPATPVVPKSEPSTSVPVAPTSPKPGQ